MHILQPKHSKLSQKDVEELLKKYNISLAQLPKIDIEVAALPEGCKKGDIIKIEKKEEGKITIYYRVAV